MTDAVIETIARHTHQYMPFDVYAKALQEFFRGHELTASEWDESRSKMFPRIDRYQKEAYWALMKIARQHGGDLRLAPREGGGVAAELVLPRTPAESREGA